MLSPTKTEMLIGHWFNWLSFLMNELKWINEYHHGGQNQQHIEQSSVIRINFSTIITVIRLIRDNFIGTWFIHALFSLRFYTHTHTHSLFYQRWTEFYSSRFCRDFDDRRKKCVFRNFHLLCQPAYKTSHQASRFKGGRMLC